MSALPRDPDAVPYPSEPPDGPTDFPTAHNSVALLRWPEDEASRRRLAAARLPRLLLIGEGAAPPLAIDELEDWIRFPLDPEELTVRTDTLAERARDVAPRPTGLVLDSDRVLHSDDRWVALSPTEARLFAELLEHPGEVVHRAVLARAGWTTSFPADDRAVDGVMKRLRRRVAPLGVHIHTVSGVGFLLDHVDDT